MFKIILFGSDLDYSLIETRVQIVVVTLFVSLILSTITYVLKKKGVINFRTTDSAFEK